MAVGGVQSMKKNSSKRITNIDVKDFIVENLLFFIVVVATIIFVISPWWLSCEFLSNEISGILSSLKTEGYKSSYIETLGAILGTFLAITGALWTQKRFDKKAEEERKREHILIIYYDFYFVFQDIDRCMSSYMSERKKIENFLADKELFRKCFSELEIYIHDEWIANVASIAKYFSHKDVKYIYEIYGELSTYKKILSKKEDIPDDELNTTFKRMYGHIQPCMSLSDFAITVEFKGETKRIMELLKEVGEIED